MKTLEAVIEETLDRLDSKCLDDEEDREAVKKELWTQLMSWLRGRGDIGTWAAEVHGIGIAKGWWGPWMKEGTTHVDPDLVKSSVPEKLNNIHDEISEASGEGRIDSWDVYWDVEIKLDVSLKAGPGKMKITERVYLNELRRLIYDANNSDETASSRLSRFTEAVGLGPKALEATAQAQRHDFLDDLVQLLNQNFKPQGFGIEIADAIIRILDLSEALGLDIVKLMYMKNTYNVTRPHRHGNKRW